MPPKPPFVPHAGFSALRLGAGSQTRGRDWLRVGAFGALPPAASMTGYVSGGVSPTFRTHFRSLVQAG